VIGISAIVLVVVVVARVDVEPPVVEGAALLGGVVGGTVVAPVVPGGEVLDAPSPLSLHAARAAAIVPARNPRRVSRVGLLSSIADLQSPSRTRIALDLGGSWCARGDSY
jgi:hypothetical protein